MIVNCRYINILIESRNIDDIEISKCSISCCKGQLSPVSLFHPARGKSLILVLQDNDETLPTGWMKLKIAARPAG